MRKFIFKATAFVLVVIFVIWSVLLINRHFASFKVGSDKLIIVVGHSHSGHAFNDELIPGLINLSQSAEPYIYTFIKIKKLIEQNPDIDRILLEFDGVSIDEMADNWAWSDKMGISYKLSWYSPFIDKESFKLLYEKNPRGVRQCMAVIPKTNFGMIIYNRLNYTEVIGGYLYAESANVDDAMASNLIGVNSEPRKMAIYNIIYLSKILDYCKQKGVEITLIRSPIHDMSPTYKNEQILQELLATKFSDTEFLDFSKLPLYNGDYEDFDHLNNKGAKKFSIWFAWMLENGLFEKADKQLFIDEEIEKLYEVYMANEAEDDIEITE